MVVRSSKVVVQYFSYPPMPNTTSSHPPPLGTHNAVIEGFKVVTSILCFFELRVRTVSREATGAAVQYGRCAILFVPANAEYD